MTSVQIDIVITSPQEFLSPANFGPMYRVHELWNLAAPDVFKREIAPKVRGVAATGPVRIDSEFLDYFPSLEIIANFGVGYDRVDAKAATERGIIVTNTPDVLTEDVADLALGLLLSAVREMPQAERYLRQGRWLNGAYPLTGSLQGRHIGLVGLGRIGKAIAKRCEAFGLDVSYFSRSPRADVPYDYFSSLEALAKRVNTLIISVAGNEETRNLVGESILDALGPDGVLVNISRGFVIDEVALARALKERRILAAGLDVFCNEPHVSTDLIALQNAVLLPHLGSASRKTRRAMVDMVVDSILNWFAHRRAVTPVAESLGLLRAMAEGKAGLRALRSA